MFIVWFIVNIFETCDRHVIGVFSLDVNVSSSDICWKEQTRILVTFFYVIYVFVTLRFVIVFLFLYNYCFFYELLSRQLFFIIMLWRILC